MTPFLGYINLTEQLTEFKQLISSLDYQFIMKDITQKQPNKIAAEGAIWWRVENEASMALSRSVPSQHLTVFTNP